MKEPGRPFDPVKGTSFGDVDKVAVFWKTCNEVRDKVMRDGPWASCKRTYGVVGKQVDTTKLCAMCLEVKPLTMFTVDKRRKDGSTNYKPSCKECYNARRRLK